MDKYIRIWVNEFDFKSIIYQVDGTKILFASKYLFYAVFNDSHKHRKNVDLDTYIWKNYVSFLQKHFKSLHIKIAKIDLQLKHAKQKSHQTVNEIILYVKKWKIQLSQFSKKYQEYFNFFHAVHSHLRKTMLRNRFEIFSKWKLKELIRRFEYTKTFLEKSEKFRKFDSKRVRKNKFLYKFFNVKNDDDDVQSAIDRSEYKNKNKNREYRENRRRENEISREKIKEVKDNNFIDFSKTNCFKCRQKAYYVRDCIAFPFANKSKKN